MYHLKPIERIKSDMLELKDKLANITSDNKSVKKHISSVESTYEKSKAVLHGLTIKIESIEANNAIHEENLILLKTSIDYLTKLEEKPLKN
uniref:Chromosome segregation ATPase n=1 Tax=Heterorhabditis bacteriophora TaxID=37862 RepID=A0A1I7X2S8_HETBA